MQKGACFGFCPVSPLRYLSHKWLLFVSVSERSLYFTCAKQVLFLATSQCTLHDHSIRRNFLNSIPLKQRCSIQGRVKPHQKATLSPRAPSVLPTVLLLRLSLRSGPLPSLHPLQVIKNKYHKANARRWNQSWLLC
jgi:hypothetical protein